MLEVRPLLAAPLLAALCLLPLVPAAAQAAEPSIDQIHALAAGGHVDQALTMMNGVLRQHPNSAKAHYVEAELYAREGRMAQGRGELARAEQLAPGTPFADVYSVAELNRQLALGASTAGSNVAVPMREAGHHLPWGVIATVGVAALGLFLLFRRRSVPGASPMFTPPMPMPASMTSGPWAGQGYGAPAGMGGSGLLGSLASGAAMGAGFAAGEEVVDHLFGSGEHREGRVAEGGYGLDSGEANRDMGGNDFGITDDSSWDDSSSDGGGW